MWNIRIDEQGREVYEPWGQNGDRYLIETLAQKRAIKIYRVVRVIMLALFLAVLSTFIGRGEEWQILPDFALIFALILLLILQYLFMHHFCKNLKQIQEGRMIINLVKSLETSTPKMPKLHFALAVIGLFIGLGFALFVLYLGIFFGRISHTNALLWPFVAVIAASILVIVLRARLKK